MKKRTPGLSFRIVLDLAYGIALPFVLIFYVFKRKYHSGWLERLCLKRWVQVIQENSPLVWIHAVSLGEARLAVSLYKQLKAKASSYKYLLTSITSTGEGYLRNNVDAGDYVVYFPLDFSFVIRKIFSSLNLKSILIIETELWPNFIVLAKSRNIPLGLINARISDKSYPRYKFFKYLVKNMLNMFSFVSLSGDIAEQRLKKLGYSDGRTIYKGSLKFSLSQPEIKEDARIKNFNAFLKQNNHKLFMAGSTHEQEDVWISEVFFNLSSKYPDWRFLIAPRHPSRLNRLRCFYAKNSIDVQYFSSGFRPGNTRTVFLMDETGYLPALYSLADAVFVGGSLVPCGGHNIIEPAFFKKAVMIGEHYKNFEEIVVEFLRYNALIILKKSGLLTSLDHIFSNPRLREEYGDRAYKVIDQNSGGMDKVSNFINSEFL